LPQRIIAARQCRYAPAALTRCADPDKFVMSPAGCVWHNGASTQWVSRGAQRPFRRPFTGLRGMALRPRCAGPPRCPLSHH